MPNKKQTTTLKPSKDNTSQNVHITEKAKEGIEKFIKSPTKPKRPQRGADVDT